jgi:hypothetical protein
MTQDRITWNEEKGLLDSFFVLEGTERDIQSFANRIPREWSA